MKARGSLVWDEALEGNRTIVGAKGLLEVDLHPKVDDGNATKQDRFGVWRTWDRVYRLSVQDLAIATDQQPDLRCLCERAAGR